MSELMTGDDGETVILASATIISSSCAPLCNNGPEKKKRVVLCDFELICCLEQNTALTTA